MELTTSIQREKIKSLIETELIKRGINVNLNVEENQEKIRLTSSTFQTVPVLFEEIRIVDFGSWIKKKEEYTEVTICVNARYKHFNGGTNGVSLFTVHIDCFNNEARLTNVI